MMGYLNAKKRNALPDSEFAGPDRSYPVNDEGHAKAALSRASEMEHKGTISEGTKEKIDAKAHKALKRYRMQ